jgi:hypothetical protein
MCKVVVAVGYVFVVAECHLEGPVVSLFSVKHIFYLSAPWLGPLLILGDLFSVPVIQEKNVYCEGGEVTTAAVLRRQSMSAQV